MPIPHLRPQRTPDGWRRHRLTASSGGERFRLPENRGWLSKKHRGRKSPLSVVALLFFVGLTAAALSGAIFFAWVSRDLPDPRNLAARIIDQSTKIYDRTGKTILYEIHGDKKRTAIPLGEVPGYVKWATVLVEDKDFYSHQGFDLKGIVRAIMVNILRGGKLQGGSTITQQLIKNSILSKEKTYTRKIRELILAYRIEKEMNKEAILELYLNEIPYGSNAYGIEAAAQTFFGKSTKNLDLPEAALLAALPRAPSYYLNHTDELVARSRHILDLLLERGYATAKDVEAAKKTDILARVLPRREQIMAPHFVFFVREQLTDIYGERLVEQGGLRVVTSLDVDKQKTAEEAVAKQVAENEKKFGASNAALVALDVPSGEILAMVGSRDYFDVKHDGNVNVALRPRQPGSSFKPVVYAAAFEKGYTPETVLFDVDTVFKTEIKEDYQPKNYNGKTYGPVTARQALAGSLNIPSVKMLYLTGMDRALDLAEKLGYSTFKDRSRFGLSLVLGGGEVKLLEHTAAFGAFARDGIAKSPVAILKVEDLNGAVLFERAPEEGKEVLAKQTARQISSILSDAGARSFIFGANNFLTLPNRQVAIKTGTTNDFHDAWTLGYTPALVAGVWVGNNDNKEMKEGADGSKVAAPIWNAFMREALKDTPSESFKEPDPILVDKPILRGVVAPGITVKIDRSTGKLATADTPETLIEEKTFRQIHDTLFYVNKDDPQGPPPGDPASDRQFATWEEAVQKWAKDNNFANELPPTESDDLHSSADRPTVTISEPASGSNVPARRFTARLAVVTPRGRLARTEYLVDGKLLATVFGQEGTAELALPNSFAKGEHVLEARVYDDLDNRGTASVNFNLTADPDPNFLTWLNPEDGAVVKSADFPLTVAVKIGETAPETLSLGATSLKRDFLATIGSVSIQNGEARFRWLAAPPPGVYRLEVKTDSQTGSVALAPTLLITIK